jgi:dipeptidyl-peptidase 4
MRNLILFLFILPLSALAQNKKITLDDIYKNRTFQSETVKGITAHEEELLFDPQTIKDQRGKTISTTDYQLSADKKYIIFLNEKEAIYRRSTKSTAYLYDVATKKIVQLHQDKIMHPSFSPDGSKIAYVYNNNLYLYDIAKTSSTAITTDGKWNHIINGNADWVYEEEFSFTRAFQWSPAGNYIAYYKFNETDVKEFNMTIYDDSYNKDYRFKYPKAGEANSIVTIHIYNVNTGTEVPAEFEQGDIYIPRIKWTQSDNQLAVFWLNRHQNHLKVLLTDAGTGKAKPIYNETNKYYIDIHDKWWFLKDGKHFIFTSEMNGHDQVYLYSLDGSRKLQLTKMKYDIADVIVDENNKLVYYTLAYPTPMDRNLFVTDFNGKQTKQLTTGTGWHRIVMNKNYTAFYDYYSTLNSPETVTLFDIKNNKGNVSILKNKVITENEALKKRMADYALSRAEFIKVPNSKGDSLNSWILKPPHFNASKKYPVLFFSYGGPGSQTVKNTFHTVSFWHHLLSQKGFIVVSVDNTGTGFRGEEFKKKTYLRLGQLEIEDQIDAAKYISTLPYVDKSKIGHYGWSYGGFMSSLAITKGADVFTAAVAGAPVTSWRYYDNIYTERFMRTPQENAKGYDETAPINFVDQISGKYLIIHGTADDNVHFQNSVQMVTALIKANVDFESVIYPNKNHGIRSVNDNAVIHLWSKITNWLLDNLGNENVDKTKIGNAINAGKEPV